jgi:hypothetical protein
VREKTDEANKLVADVTELSNWIQSYRDPLFNFVFKELIKTNLTRIDTHKHISSSINTSRAVRKWMGNQQLSFDKRLIEDVYFTRGFCSNNEDIAALDREWTICCPAFLIAPAVCLLKMKSLGYRIKINFFPGQAVEALAAIKRDRLPRFDVICGQDGLAVEVVKDVNSIYVPLCGSIASELCLLRSKSMDPKTHTKGKIVLPLGDINSIVIADEGTVHRFFSRRKWSRVVDPDISSRVLPSLQRDGDESMLFFTYGLFKFLAEQFDLGGAVGADAIDANGKFSVPSAPGLLVMCSDIFANHRLREFFILGFLRAYSALVNCRQTFDTTANMVFEMFCLTRKWNSL